MRPLSPGADGVVAVHVTASGKRYPVVECACCGRVRKSRGRGLCLTCYWRARRDGSLAEWGWTKTDRIAEYARWRESGEGVAEAARIVGVTVRTAWRYEMQLRRVRPAPATST